MPRYSPAALFTLLILAACNNAPQPQENPNPPTAIDSFGANPNPSPANVGTQFSWTVLGQNLVCKLDVESNGTIDYTVENCNSQSRVVHTYGTPGSFEAKLTVTGADGLTRQQVTPVKVTTPNTPPTIPSLTAATSPSSTNPLAVRFNWTVADVDADITRCKFDTDSDGVWDFDNLCSGLPTTSSVGAASSVTFTYHYVYKNPGRYTATLEATDPYAATRGTVKVRVPYNRAPLIDAFTIENGADLRANIAFLVSDPDQDTLNCKLRVEGIGTFLYHNCNNLSRNFTFPRDGQYAVVLEVSDGLSTTTQTSTASFASKTVCTYTNPLTISNSGGMAFYRGNLAVTPDGGLLAIQDDNADVILYDPTTGAELDRHVTDWAGGGLDINSTGTLLVSVGAGQPGWPRKIRLWSVGSSSLSLQQTIDKAPANPDGHTQGTEGLDINTAGTMMVTGDNIGVLKLWTLSGASATLLQTIDRGTNTGGTNANGHNSKINSTIFSPDDSLLVTTDASGSLKIWTVTSSGATFVTEVSVPGGNVKKLKFNSDGSLMAGAGSGGNVILWQVSAAGATEVAQLAGHTNTVNAVAFNKDGTLLASASDDYSVKVWNINGTSGNLAYTLLGHEAEVYMVTFHPITDEVISAGGDWDVKNRIKFWKYGCN